MLRVIKNVPTDKLYEVFTDLKYEVPLKDIWATYNGNQDWNVNYLMPVW